MGMGFTYHLSINENKSIDGLEALTWKQKKYLENEFLPTIEESSAIASSTPPLRWITIMHTRTPRKDSMRNSLSESVTRSKMNLWKRETINTCIHNTVSPCTTQCLVISQCTNVYIVFAQVLCHPNQISINHSIPIIEGVVWLLNFFYWIWMVKHILFALHMFCVSWWCHLI